jgi:cell division protein FtsI (penicillin-binding protein 3)
VNIKKSIVLRARIAFLLIFLFSLAIILKLLKVQVVEGPAWRKLAQENLLQFRKVKATRGNIFSDNGSLLATSLPFYKISIDPTIADRDIYKMGIDSLALLLSRYFKDRSPAEYRRKINNARVSNKHYLVLNREMINYQAKKMMSQWPIFREGRLGGGAIFERVDKRFRPFSYLALRTVGYTNEDNKGAGLEYTFNTQLAGRDGEALFRKMAGGSWKPMHDNSEIRPKPGIDIQTTIDINIQDVAESSLLRHLAAHDADYGCVVLMEVKTGEIKAMANLGKLSKGAYIENYNYAVGNQGLTDPGSTFKLASVIALFEESKVSPEDTVDTGNGEYNFYDRVLHDAKPGGYGKITVQEIFEHSSNIGIAKLINDHFGLDPQKFLDYVDKFGFSTPLGFQVEGEARPYIKKPSDKSWSGISLPWMSMGHELKVSPLQMLAFYNGIANDGVMIKPIIVKEAKIADIVLERYETKVINQKLCSDNTLKMVRKMLEGVVERGTAKNINNSVYKIAGKTGTAQKIKNGLYTRSYYTSFVGYFPADKPKYSCIVVIDNPQGFNQHGSDVAAPVFKEIADKIYARDLDLHAAMVEVAATDNNTFPTIRAGHQEDLKYICNELGISNHSNASDDDWVVAQTSDNSISWKGRKMLPEFVPDVTGFKLKDALYVLENKGLKVRFTGTGRVVQQSVLPGSKAMKGSYIFIRLAKA